jgi:uncharacterized membrane-anchored protein
VSYDPWQAEDPGPPDRFAFGAMFVLAVIFPPVAIIICHVVLIRNRSINRSGRPALHFVLLVGYLSLLVWILIAVAMTWLIGSTLKIW